MAQFGSIPPPNPLSYEGQVVVPFITRTFSPQPSFNTFPVPTVWINTQASIAYMLLSKPGGVADWVQLASVPGVIDTITTPDSTVVVPTTGNINFLNGFGMNIVGSGSNITFGATGGGITWVEVTGTSQNLTGDTGYVANNSALVTFTLPATCAFGSLIKIVGLGTGGWTIVQNSGQEIIFGEVNTTSGVGGSLSSSNAHDCIDILCVAADTTFQIIDSIGNITYV